ncbi:MAG TPA: histidine kinase [Dehalococcoidia bacterium]|nr:histidine kinase [Dehalococcoidia bacterium]
MSREQIEQLEREIADLKARWPAHSVKPAMWQRLEELEEALEKVRNEEKDNAR